MAGQADKKRAKNAATSIVYYQGGLAVCNAIYLLAQLWFAPSGVIGYFITDFGFYALLEVLFFSGVSYFTYNQIDQGLQLGMDISVPQDIFFVNLFVQVAASTISTYFWYIYLVVPGYAIYKLYGLLRQWCCARREGDEDPNGGKSKTQLKKEARASKPQYKVMRG
ncbi:unnamed protein product [Amoebophrya sp. A25]|nr:unnamed protein product [Amoebophrya sp. A25]|eukprot:GSA25T00025280001.1